MPNTWNLGSDYWLWVLTCHASGEVVHIKRDLLHTARNFKGFFVAIEFVSNLVNIINIYGPLLGSFCTVCSLHCSVVCRLDLFHFGVFPWCIHFLVHSVVVKLVVSKNCPKLVHKYLQNYSKTQYHKKLKLCQKVAWFFFVTKNHNHFEVEDTSWRKIEIKVWQKINFYMIQASTRI